MSVYNDLAVWLEKPNRVIEIHHVEPEYAPTYVTVFLREKGRGVGIATGRATKPIDLDTLVGTALQNYSK